MLWLAMAGGTRDPAGICFSTNSSSVFANLDHPAALPLYQKAGFEPVARETRTLTEPD